MISIAAARMYAEKKNDVAKPNEQINKLNICENYLTGNAPRELGSARACLTSVDGFVHNLHEIFSFQSANYNL